MCSAPPSDGESSESSLEKTLCSWCSHKLLDIRFLTDVVYTLGKFKGAVWNPEEKHFIFFDEGWDGKIDTACAENMKPASEAI